MASQLSTLGELTPFKYKPIRVERGIRAMRLLPGSASSEILIDFRVDNASTWDCDAPQFEALSYTWGSSANPVDIIVQVGESSFCTLPVTQNLAEALRYLRHEDKPRALWIDAICVNQQDENERSSQVELMADIYSLAKKVVVWLGPESHDSSIALDCIEMLDSKVDINWKSDLVAYTTDGESHWADLTEYLRLDECQFEALLNFFVRPWFSRLWIWQEVRLAASPPVVMLGTREVSWRAVQAAAYLTFFKPKPSLQARLMLAYSGCIDTVVMLCNNGRGDEYGLLPLSTLLDHTRFCVCTDPRDRIFALLSLITENDRGFGIRPDYTKTTAEVYQDALVRSITYDRKLDLFNGIDIDENMEGLPSWVPNWSFRKNPRPLERVQASLKTLARTIYTGNDMLQVTGVPVSVIKNLEVFNFHHGKDDVEMKKVIFGSQFLSPFTSDTKGLRTLYCVMTSNHFSDRHHPPEERVLDLEISVQTLSDMNQPAYDEREAILLEEYRILNSIVSTCSHKAAFVTQDGHVGLAPKSAKPGDLVTVLLGCDSAMILRPCQGDRFQVVGEAFCSGCMDGEVLLGPLPDGVERIQRDIDRGDGMALENTWTCIDRSTGIFDYEDPRLGKLPDGWKIMAHDEDEYWSMYGNEELGITNGEDPRLTAEALKERGVDLREFVLI